MNYIVTYPQICSYSKHERQTVMDRPDCSPFGLVTGFYETDQSFFDEYFIKFRTISEIRRRC